jgi:tetracycline 7-halogenase / FADH2 O2-dependent halogenase
LTARYDLAGYDLAIVGSGFAGSLLAMIAHRLGLSVVLLERGRHPRVVIGESSTPITNLLLEELATRYDLPGVRPLAKWGSWQSAHPEIACGLKRGFTFYHHDLNKPRHFADGSFDPDRSEQLLVAASPHDEIADTHWYRADFDHFLVCEAQRLGVEYFDEVEITRFTESEDEVRLDGTRNGAGVSISVRFVVDASGPRGFLHRALGLRELNLPGFPATQALYSHFFGVRRLEDVCGVAGGERPPYPVDDAAVHHVFDGGWIWVLQFNNGMTSAGIAATDELAMKLRLSEGAEAWQRILCSIPALEAQFAAATPERPFAHIPRLSFRSSAAAGRRWALLPSAAGFVDPLLSTGFPLTLLGVARLAEIFEGEWGSERFALQLQAYAAQTEAELLATSHLIAALYANMDKFPVFTALSLLYFAAVSFSEAARRLGKPQLASSFLLHDHPLFGPACRRLFERARQVCTKRESDELVEDIVRTIEPFNVAGLGDPSRGNWYPVDPDDLLKSAPKLGASQDEVMELLRRCGFQMQ